MTSGDLEARRRRGATTTRERRRPEAAQRETTPSGDRAFMHGPKTAAARSSFWLVEQQQIFVYGTPLDTPRSKAAGAPDLRSTVSSAVAAGALPANFADTGRRDGPAQDNATVVDLPARAVEAVELYSTRGTRWLRCRGLSTAKRSTARSTAPGHQPTGNRAGCPCTIVFRCPQWVMKMLPHQCQHQCASQGSQGGTWQA